MSWLRASKRPGVVEAAALSWLAHHPDRIDGLADEVSEDDRFSDLSPVDAAIRLVVERYVEGETPAVVFGMAAGLPLPRQIGRPPRRRRFSRRELRRIKQRRQAQVVSAAADHMVELKELRLRAELEDRPTEHLDQAIRDLADALAGDGGTDLSRLRELLPN